MGEKLINENNTKTYNVNEYCNLTLEQIINLPVDIRLEMLKLYKQYIESNMTNCIRKNVITKHLVINNNDLLYCKVKLCINELNKLINNHLTDKLKYDSTILDINIDIYNSEFKNTSTVIFPGDIVLFYPRIREAISTKNITCDIQGSVIYPGSYFIEYRLFLDNITNKKCYVLEKSIITELGYRNILPANLHEFEEWVRNTDNSYTIQKDDSNINFYGLYCNHGPLKLIELNKSKKGRTYSKK
jgi:hypothetical protein